MEAQLIFLGIMTFIGLFCYDSYQTKKFEDENNHNIKMNNYWYEKAKGGSNGHKKIQYSRESEQKRTTNQAA